MSELPTLKREKVTIPYEIHKDFDLIQSLPTGFIPNEDQGIIFCDITLPSGSTLDRTSEVAGKVEAIINEIDEVKEKLFVVGFSLMSNTISLLLGRTIGDIDRGKLEDQQIKMELKMGFPIQLFSNRPDVMAAELGLKNAFELTNVAKNNFYPSLSVNATVGLESLKFDDWFSTSSIFNNVIGNLAQPLFQ